MPSPRRRPSYLPAAEQTVLDLEATPPRLPRDLRPMVARSGSAAFASDAYLFDVSWGGRRALVFVDAQDELPARVPNEGRVSVVSAAGRDVTDAWPEVAQAAGVLRGAPLLLDGELIHPPARPRGRGRSDARVPSGPVFIAFDLLALEGRLLLAEPLHRRRQMLATLLGGAAGPRASIVAAIAVEADGPGLYRAALAYGLPGIVAKRRDGPYLPGVRSGLWRTIRAQRGTGGRAEDALATGFSAAGGLPADENRARAGTVPDDVSEEAAEARRRALSVILRLPL